MIVLVMAFVVITLVTSAYTYRVGVGRGRSQANIHSLVEKNQELTNQLNALAIKADEYRSRL